jgi:hypothetical protein
LADDEENQRIAWALQFPKKADLSGPKFAFLLSELGLDGLTGEDATRYLLLGFLNETLANLDSQLEKLKLGPGRPSKDILEQIDAKRAFKLWSFAHNLKATVRKQPVDYRAPVEMKTRDLISLAQAIEAEGQLPRLFPQTSSFTTLEQSVSRGRKVLGIDRLWQSENLLNILDENNAYDGQ